MKIILSHPTGNANVRAVAKGFAKADILEGFYTSIAFFPGTILENMSQIGLFSEIRRRQFDKDVQAFTKVFPWYEAGRMLAMKAGLQSLIKHEAGLFSIDNVYRNFDSHIASEIKQCQHSKTNGVYAYEDGAEFSFLAAKQYGISCLYDLPIGYWRTARKFLANEQERWPEWKATLTSFKDSQKKLDRKDKELQLADYIFVASSFTASTLNDYPGNLNPLKVIPYGFPFPFLEREYDLLINRPLQLLFVGGLSQRKGIADLFAAVENIKDNVQLTIVGRKPAQNCEVLNQKLERHTWIPSLPHEEVIQLMRQHDVLVFPSLFEGFGLVITEAMSQGTPVITTERTAGPDIIEHGKNGWIVEAGSVKALQEAIEHLLQHPDEIAIAGKAALETAKGRPWSVYGEELAHAIISTITVK